MWHPNDLVFTTAVGTPIHPRNDYRFFRRLIANAGLRPVRLHDLRHTAASLPLAQGVAARVVMELLGHSQIGITLNTYTHVDPYRLGNLITSTSWLYRPRGHPVGELGRCRRRRSFGSLTHVVLRV